jgi:hypothetical protein
VFFCGEHRDVHPNVNAMTRQTPTQNSPIPPRGTPPACGLFRTAHSSLIRPRSVHTGTHWYTLVDNKKNFPGIRPRRAPSPKTPRSLCSSVRSVSRPQSLHPPMAHQPEKRRKIRNPSTKNSSRGKRAFRIATQPNLP